VPANAYFYNLSAQKITQLNVNNSPQDSADALGAEPFQPNASANSPYSRYNSGGQARPGEFDVNNTVSYNVGGGGGGTVSVTINVDFGTYPQPDDLIIYMFDSAVIVLSPSDSVPYLGQNGSTITVGHGSSDRLS
jgi:hypothetical protein